MAVVCGLAALSAIAEATWFDTETETTYRQVTWDDFKGRVKRGQFEQARISTAIQAAPLKIKVTPINKGFWVAAPLAVEFYAAMNKSESSVGRAARTDRLLAHEQGHFDLTEVIARRLNRRLATVESQGASVAGARKNVKKKIDLAYRQAAEELAELQASYDQETRHGLAAAAQRQWSEKIAGMLVAAGRP